MAGMNELKARIESDAAFKDSLQHVKDAKELLQKIHDAGYDVSPKDLLNTVPSGEEGALEDAELEAVAGGGFWGDFWLGFKYGFVHPIDGIKVVYDELT
jgi:predicted ribosomally synthesized peptide with nif11-like leader